MKSAQRIRGRVGERALLKAHELFKQDIRTILAEVLQNSRRAGATKVTIETTGTAEHAYLTIRDDGRGLDDLQKIVTFGETGWDDAMAASENAAGMGSYAIASRGGTFRSNGRRVTIDEAVFLGEQEAIVLDDAEPIRGMEITIPLLRNGSTDERQNLARDLRREARYYPIPVTLDGAEIDRKRFTDGCTHVEEWQGVIIGILPHREATRDAHHPEHRTTNINFHGHAILDNELMTAPHGEMERTWAARIDVVDAPDLKIVLPTRHAVIKNDFWHRLMDRIRLAGLRCIAAQPSNTLPMATYQKAIAIGIAMPLPTVRLSGICTIQDTPSWRYDGGSMGDATSVATEDVVLIDDGDQTTTDALLQGVESTERAGTHFMHGNEGYSGHPTYDAMARLAATHLDVTTAAGVTARIDMDADRRAMEDFQTLAGFESGGVEATSIEVVATIRDADGRTREVRGRPKAVILEAHANNPTDVVFAALRGTSPHEMVSMVMAQHFDGDTGLGETEFYDLALEHISRIMETPEETDLTLLENFLRDNKSTIAERDFASINLRIRKRPLWKGSTALERTIVATVRTKDGATRRFSV